MALEHPAKPGKIGLVDPVLILYPAFAMAFLTLGLIFRLGIQRYGAVGRREVSVKYYQLYEEEHAERPKELRLLERHIQNHFEVPPLFYVAVLIAFATGQVNAVSLTLAWLYFAIRVVHTGIHLGYNNVLHRFSAFGASLFVLLLLWLTILVSLLDLPL